MGSLERRLEALELGLRQLSDEELDALEEALEREGSSSRGESYRLKEIRELEQAMERNLRSRGSQSEPT